MNQVKFIKKLLHNLPPFWRLWNTLKKCHHLFQHHKSLFDIIHDLRPMWTRGQVMNHLGRYDFSGDASLRIAGSLSGGELARVDLAMMTLATANVLVIDEPTNHLDVESIEALEDAVEGYEGTVIFVSHDRALLRALCTRVWNLEHGHLTDYDGTFTDWEVAREERRRAAGAAVRAAEVARRARERAEPGRPDVGRRSLQSELRIARRTPGVPFCDLGQTGRPAVPGLRGEISPRTRHQEAGHPARLPESRLRLQGAGRNINAG